MDGIVLAHPDAVRRVIATEWLRAHRPEPVLGAVTLLRHQLEAVTRVSALVEHAGGALLCDGVGLGKTYVALAVARSCSRPLVVAPASLREMWLDAAKRTGVSIRFVSMESLSRGRPGQRDHDLLIVDEAHHFRTRSTARYGALTELGARSPIVLLSATPVHNRPEDVTALLSLFLGSSARALSDQDVAYYVVRRDQREVATQEFPLVNAPVRIRVRDDHRHLQRLLSLPPPVTTSDGGVADAMVTHTLVRLWASSGAALREGLRKRLAKSVVIRHALESGRYPTRKELSAWTYSDGAVQLGFPELLALTMHPECAALLERVNAHEQALIELMSSLPRQSEADDERITQVRALRRKHSGAKIVAFSQFAETVSVFYRGLARDGGVAMLTSRGARIVSGAITRREALQRFAPKAAGVPHPPRAEEITLLVATDLLSEGVNLQDASVVLHLDLPWTAATLEQRVGRIARLGSPNREVFVYAFDPPAASEHLLRAEAIIRRKAGIAASSIGASRIPPLFASTSTFRRSQVEDSESIRRTLAGWLERFEHVADSRTLCAAVEAPRDGLLALVRIRGRPILIAGNGTEISADSHSVREIVALSCGAPVSVSGRRLDLALNRVRSWVERELASDDAGRSDFGRTVLGRSLFARLAQLLATCPRHERALYSSRITAVRQRMQLPITLGIEREIEKLLEIDSTAGEFLSAVERIVAGREIGCEESFSGIRAVLILERVEGPGHN